MAKSAKPSSRPNSPLPPSGKRTSSSKFVKESWAELKKVQWPTRNQVAQGTLVVGVVAAFFALYISVIDQIAVRLVEQLNKLL